MDIDGSVTFTQLFLRYESLMISSASWVLIQAFKKSMVKASSNPVFARLEPFLPIFVSVGLAFLPFCRLGRWDETLLYGIILGSMTGLGQKILKQSVLGMDTRIENGDKEPEPPTEQPRLEEPASGQALVKVASMAVEEVQRRRRLKAKIKHFLT